MILLPMLLALAQAAPAGTIAGQVVDGVTQKPIAAAVVSIDGPLLPGERAAVHPAGVVTSADGRFVFSDLSPGSYAVTATKGGYAEGEPGRQRPGGDAPVIQISTARPSIRVVVPMWRFSVIAGTVLDEAGEPIVNLQVRALRRISGSRRYAGAQATFTDDRGAYRFGGLLPGDYLVVASPAAVSARANIFADAARAAAGNTAVKSLAAGNGGTTPGARIGDAIVASGRGTVVPPQTAGGSRLYPPTFYPAALTPEGAQPIALAAADERSGVDIQLAPARVARVSGLLLSAGAAIPMVTLSLVPAGADLVPADAIAASSIADADGRFVFAGVLPGRYTLRASNGRDRSWLRMPVTVGGDDLDDLVAMMSPGLKISARTQFDGASPPPRIGSTSFVAMPFAVVPVDGVIEGVSLAGSFGPNGVVTTEGFLPGRYRIAVNDAPAGWMLKGAMLNGVDVSETPFDLTRDVSDLRLVYTDRISRVSGHVDPQGADAAVLLFSTDATVWPDAASRSRRFRQARAGASGEYTLDALPPGDYYAIAVPESQTADWRDPAALETLARAATRVSLAEGETRVLTLRVVKDAR